MKKWINRVFHWYYKQRYKGIEYFMQHPREVQERWLQHLLRTARQTEWGRRYGYRDISDPDTFARRVPVQDYESLKPYIKRMMYGEKDVLWTGQVKWYSKSSGTTSDKSKYIPVSSHNMKKCHARGGWDTMTLLYHNRPDALMFAYKSVLMGGSLKPFPPYPKTQVGDVSAVNIKNLPPVTRPFFAPDFATALMEDFEEKLERMAHILQHERITMIGGVPTWTIVLFRRMLEISGKENMLEIWPDFQVYIHGGVSFMPYQKQFEQFFPSDQVSYQEIYNASEGYFAVQNDFQEDGMLLLLNNGIYYEFLPMDQWDNEQPEAIPIWEVETGKNYAMLISTNGGLWRYLPGDTVTFTSTSPYKIKVTGRTKQFINTFGEEVMVENTEKALATTCRQLDAIVAEYTVGPIYLEGEGKGGHEWLIEFEQPPKDLEAFADRLDQNLQAVNSDYEAKRFGDMALERLHLRPLPSGTFHKWMRARGKLGGQNKVPRLANHRRYVEEILDFVEERV